MKTILLTVLSLLLPVMQADAATFKDKDSIFTVSMPSGWTVGSSDNPAVSLRLENGSSSIEFEKQEDLLSDYYLRSGVADSVETVRARGAGFYGSEINTVSIYGISNAYYTAYEADGVMECSGLFSYNDYSFLISAVGVSPDLCKETIASVCKPGMKCVPPCSAYNCMSPNFCKAGKCVAPPPCSPDNCAAPKICRNNRCVNPPCSPENCAAPKKCVAGRCVLPRQAQSADTADEKISFEEGAESAENPSETSSENIEGDVSAALSEGAEAAGNAVSQVVDNISAAGKRAAVMPKVIRKPLPMAIWAVVLALWFVGGIISRGSARLYKNPKIPPPPADIPPDFFFPFVINTIRTITRVQYNVTTRQRQRLYATYEYKYVPLLVWPLVALVLFHIVWSLFGLIGQNEMFISSICTLPFGSYIAMFPEAIFLVLFVIGLIQYSKRSKEIAIYDSRQTLMMRAVKEDYDYCVVYDGNGKEVARLKKVSSSPRTWEFLDADNNVKFALKDDAPKIYTARKLFGYQGGLLRSRYGIFQQDRRAGYTLMVPTSADQFQVHLDFAFARIAHPAQMLAVILFVVSYEKDSWYPTIF